MFETVLANSLSVFHLSPVVIFLLSLGVAIIEFKWFRKGQPAIKAELAVFSRRCSESLIAVAAEAAVTNTSRVKVDIRHYTWVVHKIARYEDVDPRAAWEECWRERKPTRFTLEPGETDTLSLRARVVDQLEAIDVILILDQPQKLFRRKSRHWIYRHPHNLDRS